MDTCSLELLKAFNVVLDVPDLECVDLNWKNNTATFTRRTRDQYLELERKVLGETFNVRLDGLLEMADRIPNAKIGFHAVVSMPYTCSSLLVRALGAFPDWFGINEPAFLFEFNRNARHSNLKASKEEWDRLSCISAKIMSRTYAPSEMTVVKVISDSADLIEDHLEKGFCKGAVFLFSDFESFFAQAAKLPVRIERETRSVRGFLKWWKPLPEAFSRIQSESLTPAELLAVHWVFSRYLFKRNIDRFDQVASLDADDFLSFPFETLKRTRELLGLPRSDDLAEQVANGPVLSSHAKEIGRGFRQSDRRMEIDRFLKDHGKEFERGREFCHRLTDSLELDVDLPKPLLAANPAVVRRVQKPRKSMSR